jgi:hypothetical protein
MMSNEQPCNKCGALVPSAEMVYRYKFNTHERTCELQNSYCSPCAEQERTYGEPENWVLEEVAYHVGKSHGTSPCIRWLNGNVHSASVLVSAAPQSPPDQ